MLIFQKPKNIQSLKWLLLVLIKKEKEKNTAYFVKKWWICAKILLHFFVKAKEWVHKYEQKLHLTIIMLLVGLLGICGV